MLESNAADKTLQVKDKKVTRSGSFCNEFAENKTSGRSDNVTEKIYEKTWHEGITNLSKTYYTDIDWYRSLPTDNFGRKLYLCEE